MAAPKTTADVERRLDDLRDRVDRLDVELRRRPRRTPNDVYALVALVSACLMALLVFAVPAVIQAVGR